MTNEDILDNNLDSIDKSFVRTERIQQVENVVIVGSIIVLGMQFWNFFLYGINSSILLSGIIANAVIFVAIVWWRRISIEFDVDIAAQRIVLPGVLNFLRIIIPLYNAWILLSSLATFRLLYYYLFIENTFIAFDLRFYFFSIFFSISMAILYIYYWRITKQSMDFINK